MTLDVVIEPLTCAAFAPFGDVLEARGTPDQMINAGRCGRYHDLADMTFDQGRAGISLFDAEAGSLPMTLEMVERHPMGSQAFIPMAMTSFLVIVAEDDDGKPGPPRAFETTPGQGVNYHAGVWHGVLTPLDDPGLFAVVDRIGSGKNLEEFTFPTAYTIRR